MMVMHHTTVHAFQQVQVHHRTIHGNLKRSCWIQAEFTDDLKQISPQDQRLWSDPGPLCENTCLNSAIMPATNEEIHLLCLGFVIQ